jgi:hypothetical protein
MSGEKLPVFAEIEVYSPRECAIAKSVTIDGPNGTRTKTECARMPRAAVAASCLLMCGYRRRLPGKAVNSARAKEKSVRGAS